MSLRAANAPFLIENLGGRIDILPGYYLDQLAVTIATHRRQRARAKRRERARVRTPK